MVSLDIGSLYLWLHTCVAVIVDVVGTDSQQCQPIIRGPVIARLGHTTLGFHGQKASNRTSAGSSKEIGMVATNFATTKALARFFWLVPSSTLARPTVSRSFRLPTTCAYSLHLYITYTFIQYLDATSPTVAIQA